MLKKILPIATKLTSKIIKTNSSTQPEQTANMVKDKKVTDDVSYQSNKLLRNLYRRTSGQALGVAVKPQIVGDIPEINMHDGVLTFYVLKEYSRSNSILIDVQTQLHGLPPALVEQADSMQQVYEKSAMIFLHHPKFAKKNPVSPRLQRLVTACRQNPNLKIRLVPTTIIWGRNPDKEDSLFKLLVADNWQDPSLSKQLFNIGVMGRDTFVRFHQPQLLTDLINDMDAKPLSERSDNQSPDTLDNKPVKTNALITAEDANHSVAFNIQQQLQVFFNKQRTSFLGPDLSDKRNVVDKILYSKAIAEVIEQEHQEKNKSVSQLKKEAREYLNEITSDYSYPVVRFFDHFLTWLWTQLYDGVEVENFERVRDVAADHTVVYVPCHRSHIDYLLLSFVIYKKGLRIPFIAAGNNLNLPVLGSMLRSGGAFFMRRSFRDNKLYGAVFKEYMHSMLLRNSPIEYFIEGGRSRSGRLLPPKLGMLSMTVQSHLRKSDKPIVFIPTYIGYERIMEGGTYVGELKGKPKESESLLGLLKVSQKIERIFGTVHVNFGTPLLLTDFMEKFDVLADSLPEDSTDVRLDDKASDMVANIGVKVMQNINKAAVITPISLISLVLLSTPKGALDEESCIKQIRLYKNLAQKLPYDENTTITKMSATQIIDYGIKLKLVEKRQHILGDMIQIAENQAASLSYFRNNILHVFILASFLSALVEKNGRISRQKIHNIVDNLYPFLQSELFLKYPQNNISKVVEKILDELLQQEVMVAMDAEKISVPESNGEHFQQLKVLATPIEQSLERYIMTLTLMAKQGSGKLTSAQVVDLCYILGQKLSVLYADDIPDAFDKALFSSFIDTMIRLEYVSVDETSKALVFDHRINDIAENARYILRPEMLHTLQNIADLDNKDIHMVIEQTNTKKRKFGRKKR